MLPIESQLQGESLGDLVADARRYRWIRSQCWIGWRLNLALPALSAPDGIEHPERALDRAIDLECMPNAKADT
jgi:hypothetical protein